MRRVLVILCVMMLMLCAVSAAAEENLLVNGGFEDAVDGWPMGWEEDAWLHDVGITYLELRESGHDGGMCALVENVSSNDARFVQQVAVDPGTTYRLAGWVKAEGCDPAKAGASISVINSYSTLPSVYDTDGQWVLLECYFRTTANQTALDIGARLGGYGADSAGKAWFDDLSLTRVDTVPTGATVIDLSEYNGVVQQSQNISDVPKEAGISMAMWLAAFAAVILLLWLARVHGVPMPGVVFFLLLALAALLRIYLMATQPGYTSDMACFYSWSLRMADVGPAAFYTPDLFCDYPPGYMLLLWVTGGLLKLTGAGLYTEIGRIIVKLMPMLADLSIMALLFTYGRRRLGDVPALLIAALYALSPAVLIDGAVWGQVDAVLALGLVITVMLASDGKWMAALPVFAVTALMKPQALMAAPLGLMALVFDCVHSKDRKKTLTHAGFGALISIGVAAVMLLPFVINEPKPLTWIIGQYSSVLGSYEYATVNTANFYYLLGANWMPLSQTIAGISYATLGTILTAVSVALVLGLYIWRGSLRRLPYFGALMYIALYVLGMKMHERYLFPALALLLVAYLQERDRRHLWLFAGFSVTLFLNCAIVLRDTHLPLGHGFAACVLAVANIALLGVAVWTALAKEPKAIAVPEPDRTPADRLPALNGRTPRLDLRGIDWALMLGLTALYAVVAFVGLGSTKAPQTAWTSTGASETVVFDLGEVKQFKMLYFGGISNRNFYVELSDDGEAWQDGMEAALSAGDCFRWQYLCSMTWSNDDGRNVSTKYPLGLSARYVRIAPVSPAVTVMEVAFQDFEGNILPVVSAVSDGARLENGSDPNLLIDEQDTVPTAPSYYNGMYFDEIYHARTGYETIHSLVTYETTHPALGKVFIMWSIQLFGMTPFGWRFAGALAGVLMVPLMDLLGMLLFKKTRYGLLAAFVMAFDLMHLTQTRIATIDSFAVLFILLMYLCMFRYLQMSFFRDGWRPLIPLGLAGLFMGLGCASKWTCIYAGAGLAVLFLWSMVRHFLDWRAGMDAGGEHAERVKNYARTMAVTIAFCGVCFLIIPAAIYYFSYGPHFAWEGGLTWARFWRTQENMFNYHATLVDNHSFKSPWYEWPLILKPMYYFNGKPYVEPGNVSTIMALGNPAVWWVGFFAFLYVAYRWLAPYLRGARQTDPRLAMLLLAFAAQFVPWMLVPRSMFIYHYFGSLPFVMLSIAYALEQLHLKRPAMANRVQIGYMAVVFVLFVAFYPVATGTQVPTAWANAVNWLGFLKLPGWQFRGWLYY